MLATGRVALNYSPPSTDEAFALRTISEPGSVVAIAGLPGVDAHGASVVATRDCTVYRIDTGRLGQALRDDPSLVLALVRRVLWLASMHLRAARALFISRRFEKERLAVGNLLEQSCTQLSVHSPLHTVPHLLGSQLTVGEAFAIIERMAGRGDALERSLAELCQEMLRDVRREHEFFEALRRVYHAVVTAPEQMPARDVRKLCARGFQQAFRRVRYVVEGEENLPPAAGQIFIFNHLKNHEHNTLPNNFQLTLDSHFVSAMILDRRYGDGGIRVVRHSRGSEYGHQAYYDRLGHIAVYTHESDRIEETPGGTPDAPERVLRDRGRLPAGRHQPDSQPGGDELLDRRLAGPVQAGRLPAGRKRGARAADRARRRRALRSADSLDGLRGGDQASVQGVRRPSRPARSGAGAGVSRRPAEDLPRLGRGGPAARRRGGRVVTLDGVRPVPTDSWIARYHALDPNGADTTPRCAREAHQAK